MLTTHAHVAGIDSVLVERHRTILVLAQQDVPVVMKIADYRRRNVTIAQTLHDFTCSRCSLAGIDRDADKFGTSGRERFDLRNCACNVCGIGVCHGLNGHRMVAADPHRPYLYWD